MQGGQRRRQRVANRGHRLPRQGAPAGHQLGERGALDVLQHREVGTVAIDAQQVGMIELLRQLRLLAKARRGRFVAGEGARQAPDDEPLRLPPLALPRRQVDLGRPVGSEPLSVLRPAKVGMVGMAGAGASGAPARFAES